MDKKLHIVPKDDTIRIAVSLGKKDLQKLDKAVQKYQTGSRSELIRQLINQVK